VGRSREPSSSEFGYVTVWEAPDEEHLLNDTWIGHYEVLPISG
jgi:hypothetical protein